MGFGGIVGWGGQAQQTQGNTSPTPVTQPNNPDYSGDSQVDIPDGYEPIQGSNQNFSGSQATPVSTQPTIAQPSFLQSPKGYLVNQGLSAIGAGPNTTIGKVLSNPVGSIVNALTPSPVTNAATASNVQNAEDTGSGLSGLEGEESAGSAIEGLF